MKKKLQTILQHPDTMYYRIAFFAGGVHLMYFILFLLQGYSKATLVNCFSTIFYCLVFFATCKKMLRFSVIVVHLEVCLYSVLMTLYFGWSSGFSLYLIALSSLVYFCPFRNKYIPYLFSIFELLLFLTLHLLCLHGSFVPVDAPDSFLNLLYYSNTLVCFFTIIYSAFISKVAATAVQERLKQENFLLQNKINHDGLTGLYVRAGLAERFQAAVAAQCPVVFVMADIDNFKLINDRYSHFCGDSVLIQLSERMRAHCPAGTDLCRWGGEEFVLLFYHHTTEQVCACLNEFQKTLTDQPFRYQEHLLPLSLTFGLSSTYETDDFIELAQLADIRMYQGKQRGKNTIVAF